MDVVDAENMPLPTELENHNRVGSTKMAPYGAAKEPKVVTREQKGFSARAPKTAGEAPALPKPRWVTLPIGWSGFLTQSTKAWR